MACPEYKREQPIPDSKFDAAVQTYLTRENAPFSLDILAKQNDTAPVDPVNSRSAPTVIPTKVIDYVLAAARDIMMEIDRRKSLVLLQDLLIDLL